MSSATDKPRRARGRRVPAGSGRLALALGALGVVFGDIGTSPLYAMQSVFNADDKAVDTGPVEVYGVVSLVFWTITIVVSVKYVGSIMRADNDGEGGIMALTALVQHLRPHSRHAKTTLVLLGVLGASLFYGDGVITPAISVLSAVEGLKVAEPALSSLVLPITVAVVLGLFALQRYGTHVVGRLFGPVMVLWFTVLGAIGVIRVAEEPGILRGLSPTYAADFLLQDFGMAFIALASVVLAVTGAEALYADIGHFGRAPIRRAWFFLVFPALTLNYLAQGSLILREPGAIRNPFYLLFPDWAHLPVVILATVATVIASQAVISGVFSLTRQALQLGFMPRIAIRHTSSEQEGQVYVPAISFFLLVAVVGIVLGFGSSTALSSAYGIAVTGTFLLTDILFLAVARALWHTRWPLLVAGGALFLIVDVTFFSANLTKVLHGGWLPLGLGAAVFVLLTTWHRGQQIVTANRAESEGPLSGFTNLLRRKEPQVIRVPGTAVFLSANPRTTPLALRANVEHNHVIHERVLIICIDVAHTPFVAPEERLTTYGEGDPRDRVTRLQARIGFLDRPDVPGLIRLAGEQGLIDPAPEDPEISYYVSRITLVRTSAPGMSRWRKHLFLAMARVAASPVEHFALPRERTVIFGGQVPV